MINDAPIFLTNDDGFNSKGIKVLHKVAKKLSQDIWIFAPSKNNSGKSHSITINKKIKVKRVESKKFIVDGTPVDCILFGLKFFSNKKKTPSVIISGVNHGQNLGLDIIYK